MCRDSVTIDDRSDPVGTHKIELCVALRAINKQNTSRTRFSFVCVPICVCQFVFVTKRTQYTYTISSISFYLFIKVDILQLLTIVIIIEREKERERGTFSKQARVKFLSLSFGNLSKYSKCCKY